MADINKPESIENLKPEADLYLTEEDLDLVSGGQHNMYFVCQACGATFENRSDWMHHRRDSGHYRGP